MRVVKPSWITRRRAWIYWLMRSKLRFLQFIILSETKIANCFSDTRSSREEIILKRTGDNQLGGRNLASAQPSLKYRTVELSC